MDITTANRIHKYISEHRLIHEVERITKENWMGVGSRATYYNGLRKIREGKPTTLVEKLMWAEAEDLVAVHCKGASLEAAA